MTKRTGLARRFPESRDHHANEGMRCAADGDTWPCEAFTRAQRTVYRFRLTAWERVATIDVDAVLGGRTHR